MMESQICGLTDCGMHDFGKILFGIIKPDFGIVKLADGTKITAPGQAVKNHMAYISKNRPLYGDQVPSLS